MAVQNWNIKIAQGERLPVIRAHAEAGCVVTPRNEAAVFIPTPIPEIVAQEGGRGPTQTGFWSLSLSVKWPLFDGLITRYQEQEAKANKIKEMLARDGMMLRIKQEVHERYFLLSKAFKLWQTQEIQYLRNHNDYKLTQQKLALGRISSIDFDQAESVWQKARLYWLECHMKVALAERDLMHACGYPEEISS
jgi:outer membrane protein TolC